MTEPESKTPKRISRRAIEVELSKVPEEPDFKSRLEESAFDSKTELQKAHIESFKQDIRERKKYAFYIFIFLCAWIASLFVLLFAQGLARWTHFSLSERTLLAVVGGTTADVLGLFYIVARYLFPSTRPERRTEALSSIAGRGEGENQEN